MWRMMKAQKMIKLLSVTQALAPWNDFSLINSERLENAKQRGIRIHSAAAAKLTGTFRVVPLLPEDEGYWESLEDWIDSMVDHVYDVEPELVDESLGFVGHPDLICKINGKNYVVDWKTPQKESKGWRIQLAAYCHLADSNYRHHSHAWRGMAVQPHPEGKLAKATPYQRQAQDFAVFVSALNCWRYFNG